MNILATLHSALQFSTAPIMSEINCTDCKSIKAHLSPCEENKVFVKQYVTVREEVECEKNNMLVDVEFSRNDG